ncbi:MAG: SDR family oxidoreductase, partial [Gemmatimonadales bacterium]|nr:SDR family oxidoreductase [Gemmatimonadales bacterium]
MDLGLKDRVALVCGATRGLGRAVAESLEREGARVAVNGRDPATAPFPADVTVPAQAEALVHRVAGELGRLDVLFCNAGGVWAQKPGWDAGTFPSARPWWKWWRKSSVPWIAARFCCSA